MTSCDTNVLVYAYNTRFAEHAQALAFLNSHLRDENFAVSELVLMELYVLLRNPAVFSSPASSDRAAEVIAELRSNPYWTVLKGTQDISDRVWSVAATPDFPRRAIYDARIAYSLAAEGVTRFATVNVKDFVRFGAFEVFNPMSG